MSDQLYRTRLFWDGRRGCALRDGVRVELRSAPRIGGLSTVHTVDFAPEVDVALIQAAPAEARRDMTPDEIRSAASILATMAAMARGALTAG